MATHYVYEDDPDRTQLAQGDVLGRTPALEQLLSRYHPYFFNNRDYVFFAVLTQSCDLVHRGAKPPKANYIAIAVARTLEDTLLRKAAKNQKDWQRDAKVVGGRARNDLLMFLQRLLDNNEPGHFYLHEDQEVGIHRPCCVILALSVMLRSQHYDTLLKAKLAQLTDTFQAKLGWLIGDMYGRVGTTEWDREYPDNPAKNVAKRVLDSTLHSVTDEQIKEGLADLRRDNRLKNMSPAEVFEHIRSKTVLQRGKKFELRAREVSSRISLVNWIQGRTKTALHADDSMRRSLRQVLAAEDLAENAIDRLADRLVDAIDQRLSDVMTDDSLPGRQEALEKFIGAILQDSQIAAILK